MAVTTDERGAFLACGLPAHRAVHVRAEAKGRVAPERTLRLPARRYASRVFQLGGTWRRVGEEERLEARLRELGLDGLAVGERAVEVE